MKTRNGFVSNSSSSSFCIMMKKEHHEAALEKDHPFVQACVKKFGWGDFNFNGEEVVIFSGMTVQDYGCWDDFYVEYDGEKPKTSYGSDMPEYHTLNAHRDLVKEMFGEDAVVETGCEM